MAINNALRDAPKLLTTLGPAARTSSATGSTIDLATYRFPTVHALVGTITDGTHVLDVEEADDDGTGTPDTWADVAAADLLGAFATLASDVNQSVTYLGKKRFLRVNVTVTGGPATGGVYAVGVQPAMPAVHDV
ncbi:MAG: hypothetical protein U0990_09430 [Candidatus Nanopelagicales bacterium]|nr:hypothetical protein [Candidatus Nanopelagicales bacterium]